MPAGVDLTLLYPLIGRLRHAHEHHRGPARRLNPLTI